MRLPPLSVLRADTPAFAAALARPDLTTLERFYLAGCGFAVWGAGAAEANFQAWADAMLADPWPPSSVIPVAGYRKQVDPWERMLARYPEEAGGDAAPQKMTPERWAELVAVNGAVNGAVVFEAETGGADTWERPTDDWRGDCDDYAMEKRARLVALGWNRGALRLILTRKFQSLMATEYHCALLARTTTGDYLLDNASPLVKPWAQAGYPAQGFEPGHVYEWLEPYPQTDAMRVRIWHRCDTGNDALRYWPEAIQARITA